MTVIKTTSGQLTVTESDGLLFAHGVPYATAERFQAPVAINTPEQPRDSRRRGPASPQTPSRLDGVNGPITDALQQSEESHVLTVTAPADASELPVMVWIHGGGYLSGGGEAPKYDTYHLARRGVVTVNVTYRLGILGYLTPPGLGADNLGLRDQIAALQWVRENIAAFGGDPSRVTVFGQSAGGDSVISLLASSGARGLFHRAIVQSAPLGLRKGRDPMTTAMRKRFAQSFPGDTSLTAELPEILSVQKAVSETAQKFGAVSGFLFAPIVGKTPLPDSLDDALADVAPEVQLLIGSTRDDATAFIALNDRLSTLNRFGWVGRRITGYIARRATKSIFAAPGDRVAKIWAESGGQSATFRFNWAPTRSKALGACHCIELPFLFGGDWSDAPMLAGESIPQDLAETMRDTWAAFAREGIDSLPSRKISFG